MNKVKLAKQLWPLVGGVATLVLAACSAGTPNPSAQAMDFSVYVFNTGDSAASTLTATPWTLERSAGAAVEGQGKALEVGSALIGERVHTMNMTAQPGDELTLDVKTGDGQTAAVGPFELFGADGQPLEGEVFSQGGLSVVADPASSVETASLAPTKVRLVTLNNIQLSGAFEVPPVETDASGQAAALLLNKVVYIIGQFSGLQGDLFPVQGSPAHVHRGVAGENGPIVFNLAAAADRNGNGFFVGLNRLNRQDARLFRDGGLYINLHSTFSNSGELRGQLSNAQPVAAKLLLDVRKDPTFGEHTTDQDGNSLYLFTKDTRGAGTSACNGACTETWPPLTLSGAAADVVANSGLDKTLLGTLKREDGTTQVSYNGWPLHFFAPDGAPGDVKGQGVGGVWFLVSHGGVAIREPLADAPTTFATMLNSANEVPPVVVESEGTGSVEATLDGKTLTLSGTYTGLTGPATLAHIHGPALRTEAAGVMFPLTFTNEGDMGSGTLSGTLTLSDEQIAQLKDGKLYVNVHTDANKTGEVRGQLESGN